MKIPMTVPLYEISRLWKSPLENCPQEINPQKINPQKIAVYESLTPRLPNWPAEKTITNEEKVNWLLKFAIIVMRNAKLLPYGP